VNADGTLAGLYEPARWVACETHENIATNQRRGNALESVNLSDRIFSSMYATMRITNRPQDFKAYNTDVYKHVYKDSDGMEIPDYPSYPGTLDDGEVYLRKRWGVFTNFFYEFQHVRIVDLESHLVLFAGRLSKITKRYEDGNGSIIQLEALDALNDIANITTSALVKSATFSTSYGRSDLIKYMLNLATNYEGNQPDAGPGVNVPIANSNVTTIANSPSGILTNEDIGTSTATNQHSRFEKSATDFRGDIKWNAEMTGTKHLLAEIARWAMLDPHASNTSERAFGYDFFVDANYGKNNLNATIGPGVTGFNASHFNYFKRGNRLSAAGGAGQDAAVYGLTVKYPTLTTAARVGTTATNVGEISESLNASVTTFEVVNNGIVAGDQIQIDSEYMYVKQVMPDVTGGGAGDELEVLRGYASTTAASHSVNAVISNPRSAQTIMQSGFNFEDSKEDLATEAVLSYNNAKDDKLASGIHETNTPHFTQKRLEIMYVTEVALGTSPDTNTSFHWDGRNISADHQSTAATTNTAEYIDVYNASGVKQLDDVARIQYQSHSTLTGSTNFAYILLSDIKSTFPSSNYGSDTYVELRGAVSGAKCRLNLAVGLTEAHEGRPSKVWGAHKVIDMGLMNDEDPTDLRTEIASRLAQATTGLRQGSYSFSKAPYYWWDGLVHSIATATASGAGQDITVKNINGSAAVNITNFGVREGMLVHKMTANHAAIAQHGGLDVYGYIGDMESNTSFAINLQVRNSAGTTLDASSSSDAGVVRSFAVGDPIRIIVPLRAGTEVFLDNVIAEVYGEHIISKIAYNEDPIPESRVSSIGKNESRLGGGHRVSGLISQIAQTALGVREKTQILQPQALGSLFGEVVVTIPNGSEAQTALKATWSAGTVRLVDGRVFKFAAGSTAVGTYGLGANMVANQHYIVYLDPEGENLGAEGTYHLYTKRVGTYTRDSDNIPILHVIATNTAGITKPTIRLQPNIWLNHTEVNGTIPLKNEAGAIIDVASIKAELLEDLAVERAKIADDAINAAKVQDGTLSVSQLNFTYASEINSNGGLNSDTTANIRLVAGAESGTIGGLAVTASTFHMGTGNFNDDDTPFFVRGVDGSDGNSHAGTAGDFSLGDKFAWDNSASTLAIDGTITVAGTSSSIVLGADGIAFGAAAETTARSINWRHNPSSGEESYTTLYRGNQAGIATGRALILVASGSGATAANSPLMSLVNIELLSTKLVISSADAGFTDSVGSITGPNAFLQTISSSGSGVHTKLATEAAIIAYVAANGSSLTVQEEGSSLATAATTINFVGNGVTASGTGSTKTITITDEHVGDIEGVNITAGTHLSGDQNTSSGTHTQTIDHLVANGSYHLPINGSANQLLVYSGSAGQATWQDPDNHGTHGSGGHTHSSSLDITAGLVTLTGINDISGNTIEMRTSVIPYINNFYNSGSSSYKWAVVYCNTLTEGSDSRIKTDIQDLTNANSLAFIDSLRPRSYKRLDNAGETIDVINYGLVAQEVEEALTGLNIDKTKFNLIDLPDTETVTQVIDPDGTEAEVPNPRGLSYTQLIAPLIGAVKELKARIEVLEGNV
jgi:hypothetical protein